MKKMGAIVQNLPLSEACQFLVDLANLRGGPDNITVITLRVPGKKVPTEEKPPVENTKKNFLKDGPLACVHHCAWGAACHLFADTLC